VSFNQKDWVFTLGRTFSREEVRSTRISVFELMVIFCSGFSLVPFFMDIH